MNIAFHVRDERCWRRHRQRRPRDGRHDTRPAHKAPPRPLGPHRGAVALFLIRRARPLSRESSVLESPMRFLVVLHGFDWLCFAAAACGLGSYCRITKRVNGRELTSNGVNLCKPDRGVRPQALRRAMSLRRARWFSLIKPSRTASHIGRTPSEPRSLAAPIAPTISSTALRVHSLNRAAHTLQT